MTVEGRVPSGQSVRVEVKGEGQPGYLATARMLGQAGLFLAEENGRTPARYGCLTPATAIGIMPLKHFERARVRFNVAD
jgi:short subunit dehydrogenase-like uncharacterized protein